MTKSPVNPEKEDVAYVESTDGEVTGDKHILEVVEIEEGYVVLEKDSTGEVIGGKAYIDAESVSENSDSDAD